MLCINGLNQSRPIARVELDMGSAYPESPSLQGHGGWLLEHHWGAVKKEKGGNSCWVVLVD